MIRPKMISMAYFEELPKGKLARRRYVLQVHMRDHTHLASAEKTGVPSRRRDASPRNQQALHPASKYRRLQRLKSLADD